MPSLLASTAVHCSECSKPLSGGRDTFGLWDCPLCVDCNFICKERGYLPVDKEQVEADIKELADLRETESYLTRQIATLMMEDASESAIESLEDELEATQEDIEELEELYDLLPGEEIQLCS